MNDFAMYCRALGEFDYRRRMLKLMAFLGRYGHQDVNQLMHMSSSVVAELAEEVGLLLEGERDSMQENIAGGGG